MVKWVLEKKPIQSICNRYKHLGGPSYLPAIQPPSLDAAVWDGRTNREALRRIPTTLIAFDDSMLVRGVTAIGYWWWRLVSLCPSENGEWKVSDL